MQSQNDRPELRGDWFAKPETLQPKNREGGGQNKTKTTTTTTRRRSVVNYAVGEMVMDARLASLPLVRHPSSQVHRERY